MQWLKGGENCIHKNVVAVVIVDIHWEICMRGCRCIDQLLLSRLGEPTNSTSLGLFNIRTVVQLLLHPHPYHSGV